MFAKHLFPDALFPGDLFPDGAATALAAYPSPLEDRMAELLAANFFTARRLFSEEVCYEARGAAPRLVLGVWAERSATYLVGDVLASRAREGLLHVSAEDVAQPELGETFAVRGVRWTVETAERKTSGVWQVLLRRREPHERYAGRIREL